MREVLADITYEFEIELIPKKAEKQKKKKDLEEKVIEELKLLVEGKHYHNEYVEWCKTRHGSRSKNLGNKYILDLTSRVTIC
jgi:hypothetical protein